MAGCKFSNKQVFLNKMPAIFAGLFQTCEKKMKISHFDILPFCGYFTCMVVPTRAYYAHIICISS